MNTTIQITSFLNRIKRFFETEKPNAWPDLDGDRLVDFLVTRCLPMGAEITGAEFRLLFRELKAFSKQLPGGEIRLRELVAFYSTSDYRCVRDFAKLCSADNAKVLDIPLFDERFCTYRKVNQETISGACEDAFAALTDLARIFAATFAILVIGWSIILAAPILSALFARYADSSHFMNSLSIAGSEAVDRFHLFHSNGLIQTTLWAGFIISIVRAAFRAVRR